MNALSLLAQASTNSNGDAFGGFLLMVIIFVLICIFNSGKKRKEYDVRLGGKIRER